MDENLSLEKLKLIMQETPFLMAKGITRGDMCYVANAIRKKYDENKIKLLLDGLNANVDKLESLLHIQVENDFIEIQYEMLSNKYYNLMKENILSKLSNESLKEKMQQCFSSFENGMFYPCVCGLLPVFERVMVESKTSLEYNWNYIEKDLKKKFKVYFNDNNENNLEEYTIRLISKMLAKKVDFDEVEPEELNRHWLLHGRAERILTKSDCLKLFNIIELVIDIKLKNNENIL